MQHFYVWNFSKKNRRITLIVLAFCTALLITFKPASMFQLFIKTDETTLSKGNKKEDALALTFNISWGDEKVQDILKVLKKNKTKATFFISGEWAERHPQIVEEIVEHKHEIGMLGYRYQNYIDPEINQVKKDMIYAKEIFKKLGLDNIKYIRPPDERFNKELMELAESLDLEVIQWSINPRDWENPGSKNIENALLNEASKGDIVLLHASDAAKDTADALEKAIPKLLKKDLRLVTVSEIITGVSMKMEVLP